MACDEIQGYWFSRPLEKADLLIFLAEKSKNSEIKRYVEKVPHTYVQDERYSAGAWMHRSSDVQASFKQC